MGHGDCCRYGKDLAQVVGMMEAVGMCACGLQCSVGVTKVTVTVAGMA